MPQVGPRDFNQRCYKCLCEPRCGPHGLCEKCRGELTDFVVTVAHSGRQIQHIVAARDKKDVQKRFEESQEMGFNTGTTIVSITKRKERRKRRGSSTASSGDGTS